MATTRAMTIGQALDAFLREQQARLSARTADRYGYVLELLKASLNGYGYQGLDEAERARWQRAFDAGNEEAFTELFSPEKIPENLGEFLDYFMVHKVIAGRQVLRAAGTVCKKLAGWLAEGGLIDTDTAAASADRAAGAARDLPRADRLAAELYELARAGPDIDPDAVAADDWVEDHLVIEKVQPGRLWFEGGLGPLHVSHTASDLAQPGWTVGGVLARRRGRWQLVEAGNVYP